MYVKRGPNPHAPILKEPQTDMTFIPNPPQAPCREEDTQKLLRE